MKGLINTDNLLRAVLKKRRGTVTRRRGAEPCGRGASTFVS